MFNQRNHDTTAETKKRLAQEISLSLSLYNHFQIDLYLANFKNSDEFSDVEQDGMTALMLLCMSNYKLSVIKKLLLQPGNNIHLKDKRGLTATDYACQYGSAELIDYLYTKYSLGLSKDNRSELQHRIDTSNVSISSSLAIVYARHSLFSSARPTRVTEHFNISSTSSNSYDETGRELKTSKRKREKTIVEKIQKSLFAHVFPLELFEELIKAPHNNEEVMSLLVLAATTKDINNNEIFLANLKELIHNPGFTLFFYPCEYTPHDHLTYQGRNKEGATLLMHAANHGMVQTTRWLRSLTKNTEEICDLNGRSAMTWLLNSETCISEPDTAFEIIQILLEENCVWPELNTYFEGQNKNNPLKKIAEALKTSFLDVLKITKTWEEAKESNDPILLFKSCLTLRQIHGAHFDSRQDAITYPILDSAFQEIEEKIYCLFYKLRRNLSNQTKLPTEKTLKLIKEVAAHPQADIIILSTTLGRGNNTLKKFFDYLIELNTQHHPTKKAKTNHIIGETFHISCFFKATHNSQKQTNLYDIALKYSYGEALRQRIKSHTDQNKEYVCVTKEFADIISQPNEENYLHPWINELHTAIKENETQHIGAENSYKKTNRSDASAVLFKATPNVPESSGSANFLNKCQ
ncbi:MAG: ankyrin repeat domain-containing protein [Pseudomonadota bacterium]